MTVIGKAWPILALCLSNVSSAVGDAPASEKRGFWWYEEKPRVSNQEDFESFDDLPPLPARQALAEMHPLTLAEILEERKVHAIWKKSPEAVLDYYIVQDVARRNALAFTALTKYVLLQNPELNARSAYPITNAGRQVQTQIRAETIRLALIAARDDYALAVFIRPDCPYCPTQLNTLRFFSDRHQWHIQTIDVEENQGLAARFNVTTTPLTILIERGTDRWMPIAVGIESVPIIEDNTYRAVRLLRGEITPKQYFTAEYQDGGFFDPIINGERQ